MSNLRVDIPLSQDAIVVLARTVAGYSRKYPSRPWTQKEYEDAARIAVIRIVHQKVKTLLGETS